MHPLIKKTMVIAMISHDAIVSLEQYNDDTSKQHFNRAPAHYQEDTIKGVQFLLRNPNATPEDLHNNWLADKKAAEWTLGEKTDVRDKTHTRLIPFAELNDLQKQKLAAIVGIVKLFNGLVKA